MGRDDDSDADFGAEELEEFGDVENEEEELNEFYVNDQQDLSNKMYSRPPVDPTKVNTQSDFYFMQLDADYFSQTTKRIEEEAKGIF
jgi:hypothetical protein